MSGAQSPASSWINDPQQVLARTIWGEARSDGLLGMQAVANVVMTRARRGGWWGSTPLEVCLKPWQFSTWNPRTAGQPADANYNATISVTESDTNFQSGLALAKAALAGGLSDITGGADSYYAVTIAPPSWADKSVFTAQIGRQRFYRTV